MSCPTELGRYFHHEHLADLDQLIALLIESRRAIAENEDFSLVLSAWPEAGKLILTLSREAVTNPGEIFADLQGKMRGVITVNVELRKLFIDENGEVHQL